MKQYLFYLLLMPISLHAQAFVLTEWNEKWDNSRAYTLELLASVPEDSLDFRPTEDQMSVREQIAHMAGNMFGLTNRYIGYAPADYDGQATRQVLRDSTLTVSDLTELLTAAHAFAAAGVEALDEAAQSEKVEFFAGPKTRRQIAWLLHDHATHHRGQLIVYLRLMGIQPPRYRGW